MISPNSLPVEKLRKLLSFSENSGYTINKIILLPWKKKKDGKGQPDSNSINVGSTIAGQNASHS